MSYSKILRTAAITAAVLTAFAGTASATTVTSSAGIYTSTFTAVSSNTSIHMSFITISCANSHMQGKIERHGASVTADGKLSSLSFSSCNYPVTVKKAGSLIFHATADGNGTLTSTGTEIGIHTSYGECILTTNGTDIGDFTGGTGAKLDINSAVIPRTGGSFFCGSSMEWTGSYTFTTPSSLLVD